MSETPENRDGKKSTSDDQTGAYKKYFDDLERWLDEAYMWQGVAAGFPFFLMCHMPQFPSISVNGNQGNQQNHFINDLRGQPNVGFQQQQPGVIFRHGIECRVPALWKRLLAEFLDFLIMFIMKLAVTWIAIDFFELVDLAKFDLDSLQVDMRRMDYRVALQMTHNIMILEVVHRIVVCMFETVWLMRGVRGKVGGSTPGKSMMGLRVVRCDNVTSLSENEGTVVVFPGTDLGMGWSFARAVMKNLVLALFIPFIVAFYYFPFNRASYDMICNSIVVEEPIVRHRPNQH